MFGGLAFMIDGKMCCGVLRDDLLVRVGPERNDVALAMPGARPMDFTGKVMAGYVFVAPAGYRTAAALRKWVGWGADFAAALPPKKGRRAPARARAKR